MGGSTPQLRGMEHDQRSKQLLTVESAPEVMMIGKSPRRRKRKPRRLRASTEMSLLEKEEVLEYLKGKDSVGSGLGVHCMLCGYRYPLLQYVAFWVCPSCSTTNSIDLEI